MKGEIGKISLESCSASGNLEADKKVSETMYKNSEEKLKDCKKKLNDCEEKGFVKRTFCWFN